MNLLETFSQKVVEALGRRQAMDAVRAWNGLIGHLSSCPVCHRGYRRPGWFYRHLERAGHYRFIEGL